MAKDIEPKLKLISDYFKLDKTQNFVIPEYQRGYSWGVTQCDKLWQDIEAFISSGAGDPYFFGTIIVDCSDTDKGKFSLIDGQQRTTTFILLLKALLIRLQEVLSEFKNTSQSEALEEGLKENRNKIINILYKANVERRIEILNDWNKAKNITLLENNSINEQYKGEVQKIIEAENFNSAESNVSIIPRKQKDNKYTNHFKNFKFFYNKFEEKSESQINSFANVFLEKCQVIEIRSWQIEQAITMFNSLNSTGMPLSDADIISAKLYSNAGDNKEEFNNQWENINKLANELNSRKIIDINAVLQQFMYINRAITKEYLKESSVDVTTPGLRRYYTDEDEYGIKSPRKLLSDPKLLCDNLSKVTNNWNIVKDFPMVKLLLKYNENVKLYLSSYLYRYETTEITEDEILDICECLLRLFTLLEIGDAGYSSTKFKTFLFAQNLNLVDKNVTIETIKDEFNQHINKVWDEKIVYDEVIDYDKNLLVFLNEYLFAKSKGLKFDFAENVNIEHIMPSSGRNIITIQQDANLVSKEEFISVVNKIGNKILLEEDINKSIGMEWFKTKKQNSINSKSGYKDSKYGIALNLTTYPNDTWTKSDIETATSKASNRIVKFIFNKQED
ncbi:MAG: DUF262 domain-containing protein [Flectobacillus sp.]|uniref:DUF262 domain-containing protein n=1 Tax=Flectobacillus sp. TaxID=50419 RepID=UPI003B9D316F